MRTISLTVLLYGMVATPGWALPIHADEVAAPELDTVLSVEDSPLFGNSAGKTLRQLADPQRIADNLIGQLRPLPFIDAADLSKQNLDEQAEAFIAVPLFNQPAPRRGPTPVPTGSGDDTAPRPYLEMTLRQLMRTLVTKVDLPVAATVNPEGRARQRVRGPGGFSALQEIIDTPLDPAVIRTIAHIVPPSIELSGILTMNFFGMGNFAFLVSPSTRRIDLLDIDTGQNLSISYTQEYGMRPGMDIGSQGLIDPSGSGVRNQKRNYVLIVKKWIANYVVHPLTLFGSGVIFVLWLLWRLRRFSV